MIFEFMANHPVLTVILAFMVVLGLEAIFSKKDCCECKRGKNE